MATFDELRARWVGVMEREPVLARQAGPPSWMVLEVQEKGEAFLEAAFFPLKLKMPSSRLNGPEIASATLVISSTMELIKIGRAHV